MMSIFITLKIEKTNLMLALEFMTGAQMANTDK